MKGLVLAGGTGTRLRPLTYSGAKQLVPVANRPILFYVLDNLAEAGVHEIVVIVSPETGREVQAALGDGSRWKSRLHFIVQPHPGGLAHAVKVAAPALGTDDFCMFLGDNLIGTKIGQAADEFRSSPELSALVMLKEVPNPSAFGVAEVNAAGDVVRLVEKPSNPKSNLALVGIYFFRHSIFGAIERIRPSARGELEITDAIGEILTSGGSVRFARVGSWWLDTGKKDDLLLANDTVLDSWLAPDILGTVDSDSKIIGRVRIEPGARVVRIRGPRSHDHRRGSRHHRLARRPVHERGAFGPHRPLRRGPMRHHGGEHHRRSRAARGLARRPPRRRSPSTSPRPNAVPSGRR